MRTKKNILFSFISIFILFSSCSSELDDPNYNTEHDKSDVGIIELSTKLFNLPSEGGEIEINIKSQVNYTYSIKADWISDLSSNGSTKKHKFYVKPNEERTSRKGTIVFSNSKSSSEATISQVGTDVFLISNNLFELSSEENNIEIEVQSNAGVPRVNIPDDVDWISEITTKSIQTYKRTLLVLAKRELNARSTIIEINSEDGLLRDYITISQAQYDTLYIDRNQLEFSFTGGDNSINIKTNTDYSVTTNENWISTSIIKGDNEDFLNIIVDENKTNSTREGMIRILYGPSKAKNVDVIIIQNYSSDIFWGDVALKTKEDVEELARGKYKTINGNFTSRVSMQKLGNTIEHITGDISLRLDYSLTNCDGLYGLQTVGGNIELELRDNASLEGLNNLQSVGENFKLKLTGRKTVEGLNKLRMIGGTLEIILDYGTVFDSNNKTGGLTISAFNSLATITGSFIMDKKRPNGIERVNLQGFTSLSNIDGDLILGNIIFDASCNNLVSLKTVLGSVSIADCINESRVAQNLQAVGKDVIIEHSTTDDDDLSWLRPDDDDNVINMLSSITNIGGSLSITITGGTGAAINSIDAFTSLTKVDGDIYIDIDNSGIKYFNMKNLESAGSCWITSSTRDLSLMSVRFPKLKNVDNNFVIGGSHFSQINSMEMDYYKQLDTDETSGIELYCPQLQEVGGNFFLASFYGFNDDSNLSKLKTAKSIGFNGARTANTFFRKATSFTSIKGGDLMLFQTYLKNDDLKFFEGINDSLRNVYIYNNSSLSDFTPLIPIATNLTGEWLVNSCAYNPTRYQMMNGAAK